MQVKTLDGQAITAFKAAWPCHGLPDDLDGIVCAFADNGDLVDMDAFDADDTWLDTSEFDGPALLALVEDCQNKGRVDRMK